MSSGRDVRMRGFASRKLVREALDWIDAQTVPMTESEMIELSECRGRILADEIQAPISVPEFHRSAMDGYALIGSETAGAGDYNPLSFRLIGEAFPGLPFMGKVVPGTAVRIMTGAPLPHGADAVIPVEFTHEPAGSPGSTACVEVTEPVAPSKNVGWRGEDITSGSTLLPRHRRLRPQDAAILASVGIAQVAVIQRPSVLILTTGNELVPPGAARQPYQIFDANSSLLRSLVERDGGEVTEASWLRDDRDLLRAKLISTNADVILISGGSSVGAEDHAPGLVAELGLLAIHGIAMRPSSPAGMGQIGNKLVFLLPGNPVSCLCAYDFFAGRAIRRLGGQATAWPYAIRKAILARNLVSAVGRLDYVRVQFVDGRVDPLAISGASILSSTVRADGFVVIPEDLEGYPAGSEVEVYLYDTI